MDLYKVLVKGIDLLVVLTGMLVNWWIATSCVFGVLCIWQGPMQSTISEAAILAGILLAGLVGLGLTPVADQVLKIGYGCRRPIVAESELLKKVLEEVCQSAGIVAQGVELYVYEDKFPSAFTLGNKTIAVSRGLLNGPSKEEIQGVLAHEIGHIIYGDPVRGKIFLITSLVGQGVLLAYVVIAECFAWLGRTEIPFVNLLAVLFRWIVIVQVFVLQALVIVPLLMARAFGNQQQEYRADHYAATIGFGQELEGFLMSILDLDATPRGVIGLLWRAHPKTGDRIRKLEAMRASSGGA